MNKKETLKEIQAILNQADPSRMEFGCEVEYKNALGRLVLKNEYLWLYMDRDELIKVPKDKLTDGRVKILGQKPDLQGVLRCLGVRYDVKLHHEDKLIFKEFNRQDLFEYNLSLDFDQQELSTLTAILELLKK